jgi:hypothetical protein
MRALIRGFLASCLFDGGAFSPTAVSCFALTDGRLNIHSLLQFLKANSICPAIAAFKTYVAGTRGD